MKENKEFKPYISAETVAPELTALSVIIGIILAVVFGAANAYLGLRVGMTVSASIPAAVIGMGIIKGIIRKNSVLETNMIQTIGSAGESLAAGAIFTMPALFLWAAEGKGSMPTMVEITLIALFGGLLGVLFMVPLRQALIVQEHGVLPYPEGMACSEVILAGEKGGSGAKSVFIGLGVAALLKFVVDGLGIVKSTAVLTIEKIHGEISTEVYPALVSVGYICGFKISSYMFAGGILGWLVLIPAIYLFGQDAVLFPGTAPIAEMWANGGAGAIWGSYVRYIGAGAIATGGILSLIKSLPLIIRTFKGAMVGLKNSQGVGTNARTDQDLKLPVILGAILVIIILIAAVPAIPVNIVGAVLIVIFGFFFATVSSRMVGLVGSSNNPVSGMAIATLLVSTIVLKASGQTGLAGMTGAIAIGSVICIIAAIAGDTSQDLKTGFILGATPKKQQIGELIGTAIAAIAIGGILYLLNNAWGFGTAAIPAPQANLMKLIVEGVMDGNLPWTLVFIGVFIALFIELLGIPVMPFAIGLYLPIELSACIMVGGVLRWALEKRKYKNEDHKTKVINGGVLCCSGMIAGEGLVGIILALFAVFNININISKVVDLGQIGGLVVLALAVLTILKFSIWNKEANE
ncbi:MAG TPA: oligopeptide transporter, OPT family [Lachnospiraceae bacterium]